MIVGVKLIAMTALQTDPELVRQLSRVATAQMVMMFGAVLFVLLGVLAAAMSYSTLKTLGRTLRSLEKVVDELAPRAEPLIDGATRVAVDTAAMTEAMRRRVNDVLDSTEDFHVRLRAASDAAEDRIRQFGAVLDIVQAETEGMLLGAASTARGIHTAAQALRHPAPRPRETELAATEFNLED